MVNAFGVFFTSLLEYFQTSRAAISAASSISFLIMGFSAILMGILSDRFGPRLVLTIGTVLFGLGHLLMSQVNSLWQVYLVFAIIGIGFSPSDVVPLSAIVRWFARRRGMMSGIIKVGTGIGMTAVPVLTALLISKVEWRNAYLILGTVVLVTAIPLAQLLRRDPGEMGQLPDGEKQPDTSNSFRVESGLRLAEALRTRQLWLVFGFYMAIMYVCQSIFVHIVPHAVDMGISKTVAAGIISVIGGSSIAGRLTMGLAGDRIGHRRAVTVCFIIMVTALTWLQFANELWMLYVFAVIYGFNHGGFFALFSPLIAWLFGTRSQGVLLGIVICAGTITGSISPILTGRIFDVTGSYRWAFLILLLAAIVGLIFTVLVKPIAKASEDK